MDARHELIRLGLSPKRIGYWDLLTALELVASDRHALTAMVQEVYIPTAERRQVEWTCVEAAMRKAVASIWHRGNRRLLQRIMRRILPEPPTVGEFLGAFVDYCETAQKVQANV